MNEFVIISKDVFEEMVGKFNHFSDRVNEILGKREEGRLSRWIGWKVCAVNTAERKQVNGWTTTRSAAGCVSVREPCRRFATTGRWLTPR